MTTPTRRDLDLLTEPTRSVALDILQRLCSEGYAESDAVEIAFREAEEWEVTHCPTAATPQESAHMARLRTASTASDRDSESTLDPVHAR
ncbi:MAG TPA: hypothetical protein VFU02_10665 [Polyangiaceae bacterium]|nr:hypothetical protein [Polyangiaceae bacterium]